MNTFRPVKYLIALAVLLSLASAAEAQRLTAKASVIAYGTSITRGYEMPEGASWPDQLAVRLGTVVFNAGINGGSSTDGANSLAVYVYPRLPALVLIQFGSDDLFDGVAPDQFERNLVEIAEAIKARGGAVAFLTATPFIDAWHVTRANRALDACGGPDACVEAYRQRTREVARRLDAPLVDVDRLLRTLIASRGPEPYIQQDGVNLTAEANRAVAEAISREISD